MDARQCMIGYGLLSSTKVQHYPYFSNPLWHTSHLCLHYLAKENMATNSAQTSIIHHAIIFDLKRCLVTSEQFMDTIALSSIHVILTTVVCNVDQHTRIVMLNVKVTYTHIITIKCSINTHTYHLIH